MKAWGNAILEVAATVVVVVCVATLTAKFVVSLDIEAERQLRAGATVDIPINREFEI